MAKPCAAGSPLRHRSGKALAPTSGPIVPGRSPIGDRMQMPLLGRGLHLKDRPP